MKTIIQLGSFLFSEVEGRPDKVFIQHAKDGEGGHFSWGKVPDGVKALLRAMRNGQTVTTKGHASADTMMWEFWKKNF